MKGQKKSSGVCFFGGERKKKVKINCQDSAAFHQKRVFLWNGLILRMKISAGEMFSQKN